MKRLLLSLWLAGVAGYTGTLVLIDATESAPAPIGRPVEAHAPSAASPGPVNAPGTPNSEARIEAARSPAVAPDDAQSVGLSLMPTQIAKTPAPLPGTEENHDSSVPLVSEGETEDVIWVEVSRAATVHASPSVSAPTLRFYQLGTELQLIGYEGGWFQVVDPGTSQRGWIYEKYLDAIRGPHQTEAASQPLQRATPVAFEPPASPQPSVRPRRQQQDAERTQPRVRSEWVASLVERAFRGD
jgi:Bacterial SH3 domain